MRQPQPEQNQMQLSNWLITGAVLFVLLVIVPRFGIWGLLIFLMVGIPLIQRVARAVTDALDEYSQQRRDRQPAGRDEVRSRAYRAPSAGYYYDDEKPKRRPAYVVGDDGELIEVEASGEDEKPKRGQSSSGTRYV